MERVITLDRLTRHGAAISLEGRSEVPKTSEKQRHPEGLFLIDIVFPCNQKNIGQTVKLVKLLGPGRLSVSIEDNRFLTKLNRINKHQRS